MNLKQQKTLVIEKLFKGQVDIDKQIWNTSINVNLNNWNPHKNRNCWELIFREIEKLGLELSMVKAVNKENFNNRFSSWGLISLTNSELWNALITTTKGIK